MELKGKNIVILGAGRSGIAAARFCAEQGAQVTLNERRDCATVEGPWEDLGALGVTLQDKGHDPNLWLQADMIILSPGIPTHLPELAAARDKNIEIIGELEFASRWIQAPLIAVTGTNGKSTTASLIHHLLQTGGLAVGLGGNIGTPLTELIGTSQNLAALVVEVSSFQLETIQSFHPHVALLLNISEDHLDRYDLFQDYLDAKGRIFENQNEEDYLIYNHDEPFTSELVSFSKSQRLLFSLQAPMTSGAYYNQNKVIYSAKDQGEESYDLSQVKLIGLHNVENIMAAIIATRLFSIAPQLIQKGLNSFVGLEHRMEWVRDIAGASYFNDSKATNVNAVVMSLQGFSEKSVLLIAGGSHKGGSFDVLVPWVKKKVKKLFLVGDAQDEMKAVFAKVVPTECVNTIEKALNKARDCSEKGDGVLLSPACASFDQFKNFEERGKFFKECVSHLQ